MSAERSRRRPLLRALLLLLSLLSPVLRGGTEKAAVDPPRSGFVVAPVIYYTPETSLAWGLVGIHHFRLGRSQPPARLSHYRFNFIRTRKRQSIAQVDTELYVAGGRFLIDGTAKYSYYPDRFYGIGNRTAEEAREDFTSSNWRLQLSLQRRWGKSLYAGLRLETHSVSMRGTQVGGELEAGAVAGAAGGVVTGLGVFAKWDSRDNTFSPSSGTYGALFLSRFARALGGDFAFGQASVDVRGYVRLGHGQVAAIQGVLRSLGGEAPFTQLPRFGGLNLLRGYYEGRYRDRAMLAFQAEYRRPLQGRFGLCVFAGIGQVQPRTSLLSLAGFHAAGGAGLRYVFNRREKLNLRLDVGFAGFAGEPAFYLTFAEAF
ncbi:MAG: BamA/TamA family outer membrane protein [Candidatus Aminicenantes bacterium]|nr:BamA/TamA family outer membrane protein [Candidatus Aminicenantes bacterium]